MKYPKQVIITEVGPRDGLQNEAGEISTEAKVQFIKDLAQAGCPRIETTSFVSPKWVPQMADAAEVMAALELNTRPRYIVLTPNQQGLERAIEAGAKAVAVFTAASDTFNLKNINMNIEESLGKIREVVGKAHEAGLWIRGYISTAFGCPYQGRVKPEAVLSVAGHLKEMGIHELSVGDTIGVATPNQVESVVSLLFKEFSMEDIALHLHDTRGTALANVLEALKMGINKFDSSAGGLGGCPYAPGASGNLATEDLVYMLNGMGIETGINLELLAKTSQKMAAVLGRSLPSKYLQSCGRAS